MKENVFKNNLAQGSITEREKKSPKIKDKKSKCFILKKNIKQAKNKFQPIH